MDNYVKIEKNPYKILDFLIIIESYWNNFLTLNNKHSTIKTNPSWIAEYVSYLIFKNLLVYNKINKFFIYNYYNLVYELKNNLIKLLFFITINLKWLLVSFFLSFVYFFISLFYINIDFLQQSSIWFVVLIFYYLLISTFNSFLLKYKYGKFTSAIQRFWKRTGIIFWLIEGFVFFLFFYYFLNSSQEPLYMYDYSNLNQELLLQFQSSFKNLLLLSISIYLSFILILNNNFLSFNQNFILLLVISLLIFYMLYIESYQFTYIINIFSENNWLYEEDISQWVLELELNNLRVKQQYFILCLIAKYWHFIFIFISWFFFLIKSIEINKINYTLIGYNVQNLIILYFLNLCCLLQWLKCLLKKFMDITYYWFHVQYDEKLFFLTIDEVYNCIFSLINFNNNLFYFYTKSLSNVLYMSDSANLWKYI